MTYLLRAAAAAAVLFGAAELAAQAVPVAPATPAGPGRIRGIVYDSLAYRPLEGATVFITGMARIAVTDADGRFEIDSVPAGRRTLTFSSPRLDSLGLFSLGGDIDVPAGQVANVSLGTPTFATVWRTLCPTARVTRGDSGIVYGSVTDAANESRMRGARVVLTWWDINKQGQTVSVDRPVLVARSDTLGNYYACGLPTDVNLSVEVDAGTLSSGMAETMLDRARVVRRDMLVSSEMHVSDSVRRAAGSTVVDDGLGVRRRGTATLRGEVRDEKNAPVPDALVTLPSADTSARTGADGRFVLGNVPAGSQLVRVRKLGLGQLARGVELRPGREEEVVLVMPPANTLAAVNVRADRANRLLEEFDERKRAGFGYYVGASELATKNDVISAIQGLPALRVTRRGALASLTMERGASVCIPSVFVDGIIGTIDEATFYKPEDLAGIEIYSRAESVPMKYRSLMASCGAVLFWTKRGR